MCADHAGDKIPFIYIYLQIELRNAAMHLAMWESHACFAQEGAAKQTRICLGKPGKQFQRLPNKSVCAPGLG